MTQQPLPDKPHDRQAKRAATRTSATALTVIWALAAALLTFGAVSAHSRGRALSPLFWVGVVALMLFAVSIASIWRRLSTRYPKL